MIFLLKLWELALRYGGVYKEQRIRRLFEDGIDLSFSSAMRRLWADNQEGKLEELANQTQ